MYKLQESVVQPKFSVGTGVRVKTGVMDPDFPEMELGDWAGTVSQVETGKTTNYLIQWSPETLENAHPACRDHCQRQDMVSDKMWLLEEDLELDPGHGRRFSSRRSCLIGSLK